MKSCVAFPSPSTQLLSAMIASTCITTSFVADALDIFRTELKKGAIIPSNSSLLEHRDEYVAFCKRDGDDEHHDLRSLVDEIQHLKERKILLMSKRDDLKSLPSKRDFVSNESELNHITKRLSANEKRFCTKLLRHPLIATNIEKLDTACQDLAKVIATTTQEIRERGTCRLLQENVNKIHSFRRRGEEMASKAKEAKAVVGDLQETVRTEREEHDGRVCDLDSESTRITKELAAIHDEKNRSAMNSKVFAARSDAEQKKAALQANINKHRRLIQKTERDHQERIRQIKSEIEMLEIKGSAQHELMAEEEIAKSHLQCAIAKREENLKVLVELQRRWDRDEAEKKRLDDERNEERRKELRLKEDEEHRRLCARKISVAYRIHLKKRAKLGAQNDKKGRKGAKGKKKKKIN